MEIQIFLAIVLSFIAGRLLPKLSDSIVEALCLLWQDAFNGITWLIELLATLVGVLHEGWMIFLKLLITAFKGTLSILRSLAKLGFIILLLLLTVGAFVLFGIGVWSVIAEYGLYIMAILLGCLVAWQIRRILVGVALVLATILLVLLLLVLCWTILTGAGEFLIGLGDLFSWLIVLLGTALIAILALWSKVWAAMLALFFALLIGLHSCSGSNDSPPPSKQASVAVAEPVARPQDNWEIVTSVHANRGDGCIRITRRGDHALTLKECITLTNEYGRKVVHHNVYIIAPMVGRHETWYLLNNRVTDEWLWIPQRRTVN